MSVFRLFLTIAAIVACSRVASAQYALFSRPTDTIDVPGHTTISTSMTIEAELRLDPSSVSSLYSGIFTEQKSGGTAKLLGIAPNNSGISGQCYSSIGEPRIDSITAVTTEQWHHMAFVRDGSSERLYMDGALVGSRTNSFSVWNTDSPMMTIGAFMQIPGDPDPWHPSILGLLDWVRVSNSIRYSGNSYGVPAEPASDASTLLLYTFDDAPGSAMAHDSGPNHWDGTLGVAPGGLFTATSPTFVPEPASLALFSVSALALLMRRRFGLRNSKRNEHVVMAQRTWTTLAMVLVVGALPAMAVAGPVQWSGNGHWYGAVYVPEKITWTDARDEAVASGGYLATITSATENDFVHDLISDPKFWWDWTPRWLGPWLGGTDEGHEGSWTWVTGEAWSYANWAVGEPNSQLGENFLQYWSMPDGYGSTWNDSENDWNGGMYGYVVEYDAYPVPEPAAFALLGLGAAALLRRRQGRKG
jgi:MYXO-CTERM domain-containing protein